MSFERLAPESHDALDGVPEPAETRRLIGHDEAVRLLAAAHRAGRLPQGLILAGPRGIGKATLAFHLARHVLQFAHGADAPESFVPPDPASSLFRQVASGAHPSVLHLTRPFNDKTKTFRTVIAVDEIRRIGRFLSHTAPGGGFRVVIVDPADDLNTQAANALLKNLEEPPPRTVFVLVANSFGRILPTLRSRSQAVRLSPLEAGELVAALEGLVPALPADAAQAEALRLRAGGSVRQAIMLMEHGGVEIAGALEKLAGAPRFDTVQAHRLAEAVSGKGREAAFEIMTAHALELLGRAASESAESGGLWRGERLSAAWSAMRAAGDEAAAYNLDRKQQALETIGRLHAALHGV